MAGDISPSQAPQAKRQKIFRACSACVSSKTRCEDVTPRGCSLCRRRRKECSLAGLASTVESATSPGLPTPGPSVEGGMPSVSTGVGYAESSSESLAPPSARGWAGSNGTPSSSNGAGGRDVDELRSRVADAERRAARTEAVLSELQARLGPDTPASGARGHRPLEGADDEADEDEVALAGPLRLATTLLYALDENMFSVASTMSYPDPIKAGIVTVAEAELAWHSFKARIAHLLPLPPFTAVTSPMPVHGFVVLAMLHHVPALSAGRQRRLRAMVDASLRLAMAGNANVDVVLALLILSLAPPLPADEKRARSVPTQPTALRLVTLAYSMGQALGYETRARATLKRGQDLNAEYWGECLWTLQLWAAVSNRYAILGIINGQVTATPYLVARHLPVLAREPIEAANRHLRAEVAAIDLVMPVVEKLSKFEHAEEWDVEELKDFSELACDTRERAFDMIAKGQQPPSVKTDVLCMDFGLGLRLASLTGWIPSPLRPAREAATRGLAKLPKTMNAMVDLVMPPSLSTQAQRVEPALLPEYTVILATGGFICLQRSVRFVAIAFPTAVIADTSRFEAIEGTLRTFGTVPPFILDEAAPYLAELHCSPAWRLAAPAPPPHGGCRDTIQEPQFLDLDIMNWDFSFLYPDLVALGTHLAEPNGANARV